MKSLLEIILEYLKIPTFSYGCLRKHLLCVTLFIIVLEGTSKLHALCNFFRQVSRLQYWLKRNLPLTALYCYHHLVLLLNIISDPYSCITHTLITTNFVILYRVYLKCLDKFHGEFFTSKKKKVHINICAEMSNFWIWLKDCIHNKYFNK